MGSPNWRQCQCGLRARQKELSQYWGRNSPFEGRGWGGWKAELPARFREQIELGQPGQAAPSPSAGYWTVCACVTRANWITRTIRWTEPLFCIHLTVICNLNSETQRIISCLKPVLSLTFPKHIKLLKLTEHNPYRLCIILLSNYNFQTWYRMYWIQV